MREATFSVGPELSGMKRHDEAGPLPHRAACALGVLVVLSFAPASQASCGSHVRVGDGPAPCAGGHCSPDPAPVRPCTGPSCSRAPEGAPVVPPPAPPTPVEKACLVG